MPETYTQEQIDVLKMAVDYYSKRYGDNKPANGLRAILSALSTAERERDALKARCSELEARLQGAADRAVAWVNQCLCDEHMPIMCKRLEEDDLRAAIVGKKEG